MMSAELRRGALGLDLSVVRRDRLKLDLRATVADCHCQNLASMCAVCHLASEGGRGPNPRETAYVRADHEKSEPAGCDAATTHSAGEGRAPANVAGMDDTAPPPWRSYEELTEELVQRLGAENGITTLRLERDVLLRGHATDNCIDVLWEFEPASGRVVRLLFECRSYTRRINQQALHSWRSVVDDVSESGIETVGVMVTTTGYQSGAQRVADSYGIVILELRAPTAGDLANRWRSVRIAFVARMPRITDLAVIATEQLGPDASPNGALGDFFLEFEDGTSERLADHLLRGELSSLEESPTEPHPVTRTFPSPVLLRRRDESVARVVQITATVAEAQAEPMVIETPTAEIAWMLADTLTGSHTWFAIDGRIWQTPS
jgi:hypothetical protein